MASLFTAFDASTVDPQDSFDPIPAGNYLVEITDSEMKPTKAGTGSYLQMTLKVLQGNYAGRLLWERLNLDNPNKTAVEIAQKTLSSICHATGVLNVTDSVQLHNKPMIAKVKVKRDDEYGDKNELSGFKKAEGAAMPTAAHPAVQQAAQSAPAAQSMPWAQ